MRKENDELWLQEIVALTGKHIYTWAVQYPELFQNKEGEQIKLYLESISREVSIEWETTDTKESMLEQCFFHLVKVLCLSHDRMLCLLWSLASYIDKRLLSVYTYFNRKENHCLTTQLAEAVYQANYPQQEYSIKEIPLREDFELLWEKKSNHFFGNYELNLREQVCRFLLWGDWDCWKAIEGITIEEPWQWQEEPVGKNQVEQLLDTKTAPCICIYGKKGMGKRFGIRWTAYQKNRTVIWIDYETYYRNNQTLSPILFQAAISRGMVCVVQMVKEEQGNYNIEETFEEWLLKLTEAVGQVLWVCDTTERPKLQKLQRVCYQYQLAEFRYIEQRTYWEHFLKDILVEEKETILDYVQGFDFTPEQIKNAVCQAVFEAEGSGKMVTMQAFRKGCMLQLNHQLGQKAKKVEICYQFEDLVLPKKQKELLLEVCNQIHYRNHVYNLWGYDKKLAYGKGVSVVFSGSPGTGKTMAAQVIAQRLGLELYKVNLATVVSKYIGETEKNLEVIFEEAQKSQGILFFDEADVLFSKRTEIKDSNDKYSNMEAAFMLQKMEEYTGLVILATNYQQNIDEAFKRRISFLIEFPFPGKEYRKELWKKAFPPELPVKEDIDMEFLAEQFELSGSNINNAAVSAAFLAAAEGEQVAMKHLLQSIKQELEKSGRKVTREEFGIYRDIYEI